MVVFCSPAKINLSLYILGKRDDGYHNLFSLFQLVDLCDTITISSASADQLLIDHPTFQPSSDNLCYKALKLFKKSTNVKKSYSIHLEKKIPIGGGLGGGSSNAATVLYALNQLNNQLLNPLQLLALAKKLGADVPLFLVGSTVVGVGRGDVCFPMSKINLDECWIALSPLVVNTADVFAEVRHEDLQYRRAIDISSDIQAGNWGENDLEQAALRKFPELASMKKELLDCGFNKVFLSGSGGSFVCLGQHHRIPVGIKLIEARRFKKIKVYCG